MVYERRKNMNYLSQTENKHFYFSGKNCLFNTNSEVCIQYVDPNVNYFNGEESSAKFYPSGALLTTKKDYQINITFVKNNGERLFSVNKAKFDCDMGVFDANALVCGSGVLVSYENYDQTTSYDYYTYSGMQLKETDFNKLCAKVKKFEENFGFYYDPAQKPSKNSESFIGKILRENGMEK